MKRMAWTSFLLLTVGLLTLGAFEEAHAQTCCGLSTSAAESLREMCQDGTCETPITPGTSTVTGCQNRVIFGDNSSVLNCEAALSYTPSTDVLGVTSVNAPAADNCATPPYSFAGDANTGLCSPVADQVTLWGNGAQLANFAATAVTFGPAATRTLVLNTSAVAIRSNMTFGMGSNPTDAGGGADVLLGREGAAIFQMGNDVNGAAVAQTFKAHDGITGTDVGGANFTWAAGRGTGSGSSGDLIGQTATPLATGTTGQVLVTRSHIEGAFRALVDATATTVFTVTTGNDVACSGTAEITVEAQDAANVQATRAIVSWAAVDATAGAGGEACSAGIIGTNVSAASSGTLTVTTDATTGTDLCNIRVTATGSLTETVGPRARYQVRMDPGSSTCAVNPQ
jgi:hypothetical protein